jgi:hypothetical protein
MTPLTDLQKSPLGGAVGARPPEVGVAVAPAHRAGPRAPSAVVVVGDAAAAPARAGRVIVRDLEALEDAARVEGPVLPDPPRAGLVAHGGGDPGHRRAVEHVREARQPDGLEPLADRGGETTRPP